MLGGKWAWNLHISMYIIVYMQQNVVKTVFEILFYAHLAPFRTYKKLSICIQWWHLCTGKWSKDNNFLSGRNLSTFVNMHWFNYHSTIIFWYDKGTSCTIFDGRKINYLNMHNFNCLVHYLSIIIGSVIQKDRWQCSGFPVCLSLAAYAC